MALDAAQPGPSLLAACCPFPACEGALNRLANLVSAWCAQGGDDAQFLRRQRRQLPVHAQRSARGADLDPQGDQRSGNHRQVGWISPPSLSSFLPRCVCCFALGFVLCCPWSVGGPVICELACLSACACRVSLGLAADVPVRRCCFLACCVHCSLIAVLLCSFRLLWPNSTQTDSTLFTWKVCASRVLVSLLLLLL